MNLLDPQGHCPACNLLQRIGFDTRFCPHECMRGLDHHHVISTTHGATLPQPHFHVTCPRCKFVWLERVSHPDKIALAW